ncbi:RND family transporter [Mycobacterium simiae]|uniref:MMPL family RND transporter n=1 Tax=Mycobacterium simiae TaxID=1784 RepID=A0A1X0XSB7_MYCSI|nr:RND family transporter [Mycobacterium simiae]ORJ55774.1 MMPL family RND transporter [Mycobacterium simiae]
MSDPRVDGEQRAPFAARLIHRLSVPIILAWLILTVIVTVAIPSLEQVEKERSVSLSPRDAPSIKAMQRLGEDFQESNSDSLAMIVLESQQPLRDDAHHYYNDLLRELRNDPKHVQHIQDLWGNPVTAGGAQSEDGNAAYVQLKLAGNQGTSLSNESADAVRKIVERTPAPPGVKVYLTGPAPLIADLNHSGQRTILKVTVVSLVVIFVMLLLVYRSLLTVIVLLLMVGIELQVARQIVAFLGTNGALSLSTFAVNLLITLGIAAGTDYGIFFFGRYQEARQAGEDRQTAYFTTYRSTAKVVLASGLTIAGSVFCLSFTRMPYFQTIGVPCAVGMLVAVAIALTLVPAVLAVGGSLGLFEPRRRLTVRRWRRIGTAVVRWPGPIFAAACAVTLVGLLALPGYTTNYHDRVYLPNDLPTNQGYAAANRHFPLGRMLPEFVLIEADHDMRNPSDFLILERLAKGILAVPGVSRVQSPTRPAGSPMAHTTIPFRLGIMNASQMENIEYQKARMNDMLKQADELAKTIEITTTLYHLILQLNAVTHDLAMNTHDVQAITTELRDDISNFEDFLRPIRSYFYWEKHCYDIPICWSFRSLFDSFDGIDELDDKLAELVVDIDKVDVLMPKLAAELPIQIDTMKQMRTMMLTMHSTMSGIIGQADSQGNITTDMGAAFDASKNDDSFYLPPEVFQNPSFQQVMGLFLSPDGKAARMIISDRGDPATPEGIARVAAIKTAAEESLKSTPLENTNIYVGGVSATYKDLHDGSRYDLMIAAIAALCLIFAIMLMITRSFVAAMVIVGTVVTSLGASIGLSVLLWQHIIGLGLEWLVLPMSVIILLAVGSDYNLLLVSRMKEELGAGINTGIIRAMGGTGKVVTAAGLVFAVTMASMVVSDLRVIGQIGTTIGLGLLFDTLIVRAFMTPSIATLLGRWFWWPLRVRPRPASFLLRSEGSRPMVRALLGTHAPD